jgi:hypothetical protein
VGAVGGFEEAADRLGGDAVMGDHQQAGAEGRHGAGRDGVETL